MKSLINVDILIFFINLNIKEKTFQTNLHQCTLHTHTNYTDEIISIIFGKCLWNKKNKSAPIQISLLTINFKTSIKCRLQLESPVGDSQTKFQPAIPLSSSDGA